MKKVLKKISKKKLKKEKEVPVIAVTPPSIEVPISAERPFNKDEIDLEARIDLRRNAVFVKPNSGDIWIDFGYWLEVTGTVAAAVRKNKGWSQIRILWYMLGYFRKCLRYFKEGYHL